MRLRSGRVSSGERTKPPKRAYKNIYSLYSPGQRPEEKSLMSETELLTTPQDGISDNLNELLNLNNQNSPVTRAILKKHTDVNHEEDINKELQQNALIAKTILDTSGHVTQLETLETIHSRESLRKAIGPQLEFKKTDNRKTLDTGTINKEVKTPLRTADKKKDSYIPLTRKTEK